MQLVPPVLCTVQTFPICHCQALISAPWEQGQGLREQPELAQGDLGSRSGKGSLKAAVEASQTLKETSVFR